jgi:glycosyltransferase involved in cell wall biosynthesis
MKNKLSHKKIAIVSDAVYPFNKGGKEKRLHDITTRLAKEGYEITVYCMQWWPGEKTIVREGVTFQAISPYYPLYHQGRRSMKQGIFFALHCLKLISKKFDVMEVDHMPHMVLYTTKMVCLLKNKRMIAVWHEVWGLEYWKHYLGGLGWLAYLVERISVMLPDTIISVSAHTTARLQSILGRKKNIVTISNGLDLGKFQNVIPAEKKSDIIFAGRLLSHKNVDMLLRAINILKKHNPKISAIIIGDGPEKENLEKIAVQLEIQQNVSFLGFLEKDEEVFALMSASKIFVLPSIREGFGITVIEANACGLPVITIDCEENAAKELIADGENGNLCALDEQQLAATMEKLLVSREGPAYYRQYAEKYDWGKILSKLEKVYQLCE